MQESHVTTVDNKKPEFSRFIPVWRFILLTFVTFGIYELIWFYRSWKFLKEKKGLDIYPFWRAFFAPFFTGSLAKHFQEYLKEKEFQTNFSPTFIGVSYFIIFYLWRLPDPFWLLSFLSFVPLLPLLNSINRYWSEQDKNLSVKSFTWWQITLIIIGGIFTTLSILETFVGF